MCLCVLRFLFLCFTFLLREVKFFLFLFSGGGGANKQHVTTKNTAKLDRETEELKHDKVPLDLGRLIQQGRQNKGMSQKDLATVIFFILLNTIIFNNCVVLIRF